jgi:hypothetical protein
MKVPSTLYKYQSRLAGRAVLENRTLRWSTPATLNDPFDIQFDLSSRLDEQETLQVAMGKLWGAYKGEIEVSQSNPMGLMISFLGKVLPNMDRVTFEAEFREAVQEGIRRGEAAVPEALAKSRALLATSKILCLTETQDNQLMWAHYGESHRGIVLHFSTEEGTPYHLAKPIQYLDIPPPLHDAKPSQTCWLV